MLRGIFKASPTTMVDGQQREFRLNAMGALVTADESSASAPTYTRQSGTQFTRTNYVFVNAATQVLPASPARSCLHITPPADCILTVNSGDTVGITLIGGLTNTFSGSECPTNALFLSGLTAGAAVTILEG